MTVPLLDLRFHLLTEIAHRQRQHLRHSWCYLCLSVRIRFGLSLIYQLRTNLMLFITCPRRHSTWEGGVVNVWVYNIGMLLSLFLRHNDSYFARLCSTFLS